MTALILALTTFAHAGADNDWTGPVALPGNTDSIALTSVEGKITVTVDPLAKVPAIQATDFRPGRACALEVVKDRRGETQVNFGPKDLEDAKECRAEFAVTLPPGMKFAVDLGLGDLVATGMDGSLQARLATGDIELTDHSGFAALAVANGNVALSHVSGTLVVDVAKGRLSGDPTGPVRAKVGEGSIHLDNLADQIEADTGVGDILLNFAALPGGPLMLNAGNGHVVVDLPDGTTVNSQLSSMTGTTSCELAKGDQVEVVAVAGMGSVRVF